MVRGTVLSLELGAGVKVGLRGCHLGKSLKEGVRLLILGDYLR